MRSVLVAGFTAVGLAVSAGVAVAQEETPEPQPEINCFPILSSLICYLPVDIGPFNITVPVDIDSVFPPPPAGP
jgi:hypothetical protein